MKHEAMVIKASPWVRLNNSGQHQRNQGNWLPVAAETNGHALGGLKNQKFILSQFWAQEVQNQSVSGATLPPKALGKEPSWLLPAFDGPGRSSAPGYITDLCLQLHVPFFCVISSSASYKDTYHCLGPTRII